MTGSKKTNEAPDALLDAATKDAKITRTELSEEELKNASGGKLPTSSGLPVAAAQADIRRTTVAAASEFLTTVCRCR